jgi:chromosome segregation ATPase
MTIYPKAKRPTRFLAVAGLTLSIFMAATVSTGAADADAMLTEATKFIQQKRFVDAVETLSRASALYPENQAVADQLAEAKAKLREQMGTVQAERISRLINDIEALEKDQLKALKTQVRELREAKHQADLEAARLQQLVAQATAADADMQAARDEQVQALTAEMKKVEAARQAAEKRAAELQGDLQTLEKTHATLTRELADVRAEAAALRSATPPDRAEEQAALDTAAERIAQLETRLAAAEAARADAENRAATSQKTADDALAASKELQQELQERQSAPVPAPADERITDLSRRIQETETAREKAAAELAATLQQLEKMKAQQVKTAEDQTVLLQEMDEQRDVAAQLTARLQNIQQARERAETRLTQAERDLSAAEQARQDLESQLQTAQRELSEARSGEGRDVRTLRKQISELEEDLVRAKAETEAARDELKTVSAQKEKALDEISRLQKTDSGIDVPKELAESREQVDSLRSENRKLKEQLKQSKREEAQAEFRVQKLLLQYNDALRELERIRRRD